ncbi:MAG: class I SAM-dependent DNA methyltransferase [Ruminococcus sp.]|nr:class I SAM-dependent DNA methyltransferase [Ruminococcus sp.]MBQ4105935.1 class I SAM-dependent DNA methyltransferase [Clostridia bacterium]
MRDSEIRANAKKFAEFYKDKGYEKGESQPFWLSLLRDVLGVSNPEQFITFEDRVKLDHTSFIDGYIPATHVLIEQKGRNKDLRKPIKQSDGSVLTPFQQAQRYSAALPYSDRPRWIVVCNFEEFLIYDMEHPNSEPEQLLLKNLPKEYYRLKFLVDTGDENIHREMQVSIEAGKIVGLLYDAILKQYHDPESDTALRSLNMLCVRLVFCLYAEDAGIFGGHNKFHNYISSFPARDMRRALIDLFRILDTKAEDRDPYEDKTLLEFPYVNGGLFAETDIEIPQFSDEIRDILLKNASADFDWSDISPTIFGAVFESTLNPETRRSGGMHYTSVENIHKVIDPLFLTDLSEELQDIKDIKVAKTRERKLDEFRTKLSTLTFLDPACGSGNFLTETYISLRKLENEALKALEGDQIVLDTGDIIRVSIGQFYGIEINDFAVTVAKTALWIAESQMMKKTEDIVHMSLEFLPLKSYANIVEANALRIDWEDVVPKEKLNYIMGNPPYVGGMMTSKAQKAEMIEVIGNIKGIGELDYVSAWYYKTSEYIKNTEIVTAFVSTNSICQGQQAVVMWKPLIDKGIKINFAYRTFIWDSEANVKSHVHCVIIGFSYIDSDNKLIFDDERVCYAHNISPYLTDTPDVFIESRSVPICDVPKMFFGSMARDGGGFIFTDNEKDELLKSEPLAEKWLRKYVGAQEFIKNKSRWCLWLVGANPHEVKSCPTVMARVAFVKEFREKSVAASTRKFAEIPALFCQIAQPDSDYIIIPRHSSETRRYIPIGFMESNVIASDAVLIIPNASIYSFGVLTSTVHNAWMRTVCGRIKSDYRYSKDIVYNNFPWPNPTDEQKAEIERTVQAILDAREKYPDCSLADLYDELTMPPELRKAHQANDRAVMKAYGFKKDLSESAIVAELMKMYQELTS